MLSQRAFDAIFRNGPPDLDALRKEIDSNKITDQGRKLVLSVIRGAERAERKRRRLARYLRHYQRIAASLS